ncbi:MAG TPA: ABC transporter permease [Mucilaginibacter sp.]|nr:ABC transporter permease [Mucilaginibacter sp.]
MIKNYLKSALRNIQKHPFISFVNISGLTIGLTCCLLILLYIINERNYDRFNANTDNIYRVTRIFYSDDGAESLHTGSVAPPFGPLLKNAFPDIQKVTRLLPKSGTTVQYGGKLLDEKEGFFADENLFDFFTVPVVQGDPHQALLQPFSVMLTEELAKKYFGTADPMNKTIKLDGNKHEYKVTGIYKSFPANSHLHPQMLLSFNTLKDTSVYGESLLTTKYNHNAFFTYLLLPKNYNITTIEKQLPDFLDKYVILSHRGTMKTHQATALTFQKLADIHLHSHLDREIEENGDIKRVYIFSAVALFVLLIACINYMNLSTARSVLRAREMGVRKVLGAQRKSIIVQFLSESVLITLISLTMALFLTSISLSFVNKLSNLGLSFSGLLQWPFVLMVLAIPFILGLISGIYPALFMSSFVPVKVLKGVIKVGSNHISFRKVLVVVQFSISIMLIIATTVVYQQLQYVQAKALGFNKDHVLTMTFDIALMKQYETFKADLLKNPSIKVVGRSTYVPSERVLSASDASIIQNGLMQRVKIELMFINTDYDFLKTYDMPVIAGRNFSHDFPTDTNSYLLNETAVKALGWKNPENAIGKIIKYGDIQGKVVGIVKDSNFESLHQNIIPLLFALPSFNYYPKISVKVDGHNVQSAINTLADTWHKYLPESPFEYTFLDERFDQLYKSEQQQGQLFTIFSCIAILIACLGLFGLSAFTISQRFKEIGIRKVLGATVSQIVSELSKDFLKLVLIAAVIAFPIARYSMNKWLLDFAYRINISWWVFAIAGVAALLIAFATISFQSVKAALTNPIKSLRSE